MWHEARKQEKKLRVMIVDYRKRAERRREFYEKFKADPTQFMQVHGRPSKIYLEPQIAASAENCMMPWQGNADNMIDRFDVRAHLDIIPEWHSSSSSSRNTAAEEEEANPGINYERYRILIQNELAGTSEDKFLHQIHLEEQFGTSATTHSHIYGKAQQPKAPKAAIGYTYEDSTPAFSTQPLPTKGPIAAAAEADEESEEEIDFDLIVNVDDLTHGQKAELNNYGTKYGLQIGDFMEFLNADLEEKEKMRLAKLQEEEKQAMSGRKARRERRAYKDKLIMKKGHVSPPSYATYATPADEDPSSRRSSSRSESRSRSRSNSPEKITFITSFGGNESDDGGRVVGSKPLPFEVKSGLGAGAPSLKKSAVFGPSLPSSQPEKKGYDSRHGVKKRRSRSRSRSRDRRRSTSSGRRCRSRSRSRSSPPVSRLRSRRRSTSKSSRSRSRSRSRVKSRRRRRSSSSSRSRSHSRSRSSRRRHRRRRTSSSHSRSRSRDRSSRRRRRSSRSSRSRSGSRGRKRRSTRSSSRSRRRKSRSYSRSRSRRSRSRSLSRGVRGRRRYRSSSSTSVSSPAKYSSRRRRRSTNSSSSSSSGRKSKSREPSLPRSPKESENGKDILPPATTAIFSTTSETKAPSPPPPPPVRRYYGRHGRSSSSESSKSSSDNDSNKESSGSSRQNGSQKLQSKRDPDGSQLAKGKSGLSSASKEDLSITGVGLLPASSSSSSMAMAMMSASSVAKLTPKERLRRKMQFALSKTFRADKEAEKQRLEKMNQERMEREESLRELTIKYRRREREKRHRDRERGGWSSSSSRSSRSRSRSPASSRRSRSRSRSPY